MIRIALVLAALGSMPVRAFDGELDVRDDVARFVDQLAAERFADREEAARRLVAIGGPARAALVAALGHEEPEVRHRARRVLLAIERTRRARVVAALRNGVAGTEAPGWDRFRDRFGSDERSRRLYAGMLEYEWDLLAALDREPEAVARELKLRLKKPKRYSGEKPNDVPAERLGAYVFVALEADDEPSHVEMVMQRLQMAKVVQRMQGEPTSHGLERLLDDWIVAIADEDFDRLEFACTHGLRGGMVVAREMLGRKPGRRGFDDEDHHRIMVGLLVVALLGGPDDVAVVQPHLGNAAELDSGKRKLPNGKKVSISMQVRDVALYAAIRASGREPGDFGFAKLKKPLVGMYDFSPKRMGFENDERRAEALEKWRSEVDAVEPGDES